MFTPSFLLSNYCYYYYYISSQGQGQGQMHCAVLRLSTPLFVASALTLALAQTFLETKV